MRSAAGYIAAATVESEHRLCLRDFEAYHVFAHLQRPAVGQPGLTLKILDGCRWNFVFRQEHEMRAAASFGLVCWNTDADFAGGGSRGARTHAFSRGAFRTELF